MKKRYVLLLCAAALSIGAACSSVSAHGVFIANRFDQKALVLGEGPTDNAYNPFCVKAVEAYDKNFDAMNVETVNYEDHISIIPTDELGVTVTFFDYGFFTKTAPARCIRLRLRKWRTR